jgi:hypothetical protein
MTVTKSDGTLGGQFPRCHRKLKSHHLLPNKNVKVSDCNNIHIIANDRKGPKYVRCQKLESNFANLVIIIVSKPVKR